MRIGEGTGAAARAIDGDLGAVCARPREDRPKTRAILPCALTEFLAYPGRGGRRRDVLPGTAGRDREAASAGNVFLYGHSLKPVARQQSKQGRLGEVADVLFPED